jgi:hydrogenase expression/formation protein HypE
MSKQLVMLEHGSGGRASANLIEQLILPAFSNRYLAPLADGAILDPIPGRIAVSTDSFVVDPIFFNGGDIGSLAVNGTVNDIAMCGATPKYLSAAFVLEEGFPLADLKKILSSMKKAAKRAGVLIVSGDTKVVPKGKADKIFINTTGVGSVPFGLDVGPHAICEGDAILLSGFMGDHGLSIMMLREDLGFFAEIQSDTAPLNGLVCDCLAACHVHALRDPTRGGVGGALWEIARASGFGISIQESGLPVRPQVESACQLLGLDPLYVANEGCLLAFVPEGEAKTALKIMQNNPFGKNAAIIGRVTKENKGQVFLETRAGGTRIINPLAGELLPRIC